MIVKARKLWENGTLTSCAPITLRCDQISLPRPAWLTPGIGGCLGNYNLLLAKPDPYPLNTITGVYVTLPDGGGVVLDAAGVSAIVDVCNGCCGDIFSVPGVYDGSFPAPQQPVFGDFIFSRTDRGDWYALNRAQLQYKGQYITGTFNRTSYNYTTGVSLYQFRSYGIPVPVAGDTVQSGSWRTFISASNLVTPVPAGSEIFMQVFYVDGTAVGPEITNTTSAASLRTAVVANATYAAMGSWGAGSVSPAALSLRTDTEEYSYLTIATGTRTL